MPFHVNTGLFEVQAAKLCIEMNMLDQAELHFEKAKFIFQLVYGEDQSDVLKENCAKIQKDIEEKRKKLNRQDPTR